MSLSNKRITVGLSISSTINNRLLSSLSSISNFLWSALDKEWRNIQNVFFLNGHMGVIDTPSLRDIFIVRSTHYVPSSQSTDADYEAVSKQLEVARRIVGRLISDEGVDHIFFDGLDQGEADAWNTLLKADPALYRHLHDHISYDSPTEDQKDHLKWVAAIRRVRESAGKAVEFYETEPKNKRGDDAVVKAAMSTIGVIPFKLQANIWFQLLGKLFGRKIQPVTGLASCLRDKDTFPIIQTHAGASNVMYMGKDHQHPDLYKRGSGFRVAGVTVEDDLSFSLDAANTDDEMPERLSRIVSLAVTEVLRDC